MSDTTVQDCICCEIETDCIYGLCESCSDFNYKLQKQIDALKAAGKLAVEALCCSCSARPIDKCHPDTKKACTKGRASLALTAAALTP